MKKYIYSFFLLLLITSCSESNDIEPIPEGPSVENPVVPEPSPEHPVTPPPYVDHH